MGKEEEKGGRQENVGDVWPLSVAKSGVEGNCSGDGVKTTWGHQERV